MKRPHMIAGGFLALALVVQFVPVDRSNPPETAVLALPADIAPLIERACIDCHSHRTRWPWYGWVAPVSWLLRSDVREARREMNFSTWGEMARKDQQAAMMSIRRRVKKGEMPLPKYLWMHPEAVLTDAERQRIQAWALGRAEELGKQAD